MAGSIIVSGWSLELEDAAVQVELVVDGRVVATAAARTARQDVCASYSVVSHCADSAAGFSLAWDTAAEVPGPHSVGVRILDPAGGIALIGERLVNVAPKAGAGPPAVGLR